MNDSDHRWRTCVVTRLNRNQVVEILCCGTCQTLIVYKMTKSRSTASWTYTAAEQSCLTSSGKLSVLKYSSMTMYDKQVAQLSQKDHAAGWVSFGRKWKTGTGIQYSANIIGLSSTIVTKLASKAIEFGEKSKIRAITPFKVIQGHRGHYQWKAHMRLTDILSRTVLELSQLTLSFWATLWGLRANVQCSS